MEAKPAVDWNLAKSLFLRGLTDKETAFQSGASLSALRTRITREHWRKLRTKTVNVIGECNAVASVNALQRSGERTRQLYATSAEKLALDLSQREIPAKLERANLLADTMSKGAKVAALVHGWESTTINAIVMAGDTTDAIESLCAEPIDVESVPTEQA